MSEVYDWLRMLSYPLPLSLVSKLALGTLTDLDMIQILVEIEQHDNCVGWQKVA